MFTLDNDFEYNNDKTEDAEYDEANEVLGCSGLVNDQGDGEELGLHIIFGGREHFDEF